MNVNDDDKWDQVPFQLHIAKKKKKKKHENTNRFRLFIIFSWIAIKWMEKFRKRRKSDGGKMFCFGIFLFDTLRLKSVKLFGIKTTRWNDDYVL